MFAGPRRLLQRANRALWRRLDRAHLAAAGGDQRPVFFDVRETYPALLAIDRNHDLIRAELEAVIGALDQVPRYHEVDANQAEISAGVRNWRTLFLHLKRAGKSFPNRRLFPRTAEVLDSIPNVGQAFFSILDPRKSVPAHCGPHYYYLRYHTAFRVPRENPPSIRVKDRHYTWREGESVLFDDSWEHEVFNEADDLRIVLITDVWRPGPTWLRALHRLCYWTGHLSTRQQDLDRALEPYRLPPALERLLDERGGERPATSA